MEKYSLYFLVIGLLLGIVKAQAEAVFSDYDSFYDSIVNDEKQLKSNERNDENIDRVENFGKYNIDQIINSALGEGLAGDDSQDDDNQFVDDNQEAQDDNVNYEVQNDENQNPDLENGEMENKNVNSETQNDENQNLDSGLNDEVQGFDLNAEVRSDNQNRDDNDEIQSLHDDMNSDEERVQSEIENFKQLLAGEGEIENGEVDEADVDGNLDDYQVEDNRSDAKEARNDLPSDSDGSFENKDNVEENFEAAERIDFPDPVADNPEIFEDTKNLFYEPDSETGFVDEGKYQAVDEINQKLEGDQNSNNVDEPMEVNEQVEPAESVNDEDIADEENHDLQIADDQIEDEQVPNEQIQNEQNVYEQISDERNPDEVPKKQSLDEPVPIEDTLQDQIQDESNHDYDQVEIDYEQMAEDNFADYYDGQQESDSVKMEAGHDLVNEEEAVETPLDNNEQQFDENMSYDEEDTVDKVQADLDRDIEHLFDTWKKLSQDSEEIPELVPEIEVQKEGVVEYEQKNGKPYGEETVLSQRDYEYDDKDQINNDAIERISKENVDKYDVSNEGAPETQIDDNVFFGVHKLINAGEYSSDESSDNENADIHVSAEIKVENDQLKDESMISNEKISDEINPENVPQDIDVEFSEVIEEENEPKFEKIVLENVSDRLQQDQPRTEEKIPEKPIKTMDVSELTSAQYDALMEQFALVHLSDMDAQPADLTKDVAPIYITLTTHESTVVTSPNYPEAYPTNNVIDWIFEGEGVGIEFNITDLELNGALGDYLLVKPGSSDVDGAEGLIFSFRLTEPRQYRFLDVDRMFVRFQSNAALGGLKGFSFSVKMVAAIPEEEPSPIPEPEPLLPPPATLTVYLGGVTFTDFREIKEDFRRLVADMATLYINTHGIDYGLNTTIQVTQIISTGICNVNWPNFENCVVVTFGVPLAYEDEDVQRLTREDLADMWGSYFYIDPFAHRLGNMGIVEFSSPNESAILTAWLVIGGGVLISAAMLAFALWRFNCFEDYTRMSPYSDTDSIRSEKRGLDLYPTPHQTLPPLYSQEYKWVDDDIKVDMGGFANKSYARDELFNIDSDDDVSSPRERYTSDV